MIKSRLLSIAALFMATSAAAQSQGLTCPAELESAVTADGLPQSFKFRYVSFFDGDPSDRAALAPDDGVNPQVLDQRWQFTRTHGRPIIMICRYHGTEQTVRKEVPAGIKECRLEGFVSETGEVVGSPQLQCR